MILEKSKWNDWMIKKSFCPHTPHGRNHFTLEIVFDINLWFAHKNIRIEVAEKLIG